LPVFGLILVGLLLSGLIGALPSFVRFLAVFSLFTFIPGELLMRVVFPGRFYGVTSRLPVAFLAGLSVFVVVAWVCSMMGTSFRVFVGAIGVVTAAISVLGLVRPIKGGDVSGSERAVSRTGTRRGGNAVFATVAVLLAVFFVAAPPALDYRGDGFVHLGYLRSIISENAMIPSEVLGPALFSEHAIPEADPRSGALHPLLAALAFLSGIEPLALWTWLPVVLAPVAFLGFAGFAAALLPGAGYLAAAVVLFMMFQGGIGRHFLGAVGYGQHLAIVFYWVLVVICLSYSNREEKRTLALIGIVALAGGLVHVDVIVHVGLMWVGFLVGARAFGFVRGTLFSLGLVLGVLSGVALAWKYIGFYDGGNIIHTHPHGLLYFFDVGDPFFIPNPGEIVRRNGLPFLAAVGLVVFLPFLGKHRRFGWMSFSLSFPIIVTALNPFVAPFLYTKAGYLVHRFLFGIPAAVILALVVGSVVAWGRRGRWWQKTAAVIFLLLLAKPAILSSSAFLRDVRSVRMGAPRAPVSEELGETIAYINEKLPDKSVVLSDAVTSYTLSAFSDARVVAVLGQHGNPNDPYAVERLQGIHAALSPYTTQIEALNALRRFGVEYVLVNGSFAGPYHDFLADWDPAFKVTLDKKFGSLRSVFKQVHSTSRITLYEVVGDEFERVSWHPIDPFGTAPDIGLDRCPKESAPIPMVTGLRFSPTRNLPGEKVRVSVSYRGAEEFRQTLPLSLRLRFEDSEYFETAAEFFGDKLLRRYRERRDATFKRFRVDHRPFGGYYRPAEWPISRDCFEIFDLRLPTDLGEGAYEVQIQLVEEPLLPNYAVRDLFYNDDSRVGATCTKIEIRRQLVR
jgi:hypothetical protein